jgi:hypothetical protein
MKNKPPIITLKTNFIRVKLFILLGFIFLFISIFSIFAHEETDNDSSLEVAPEGKLNVRSAKTSALKVVAKYPTTLVNKKLLIEFYINDLSTSEPITGANVTAIFNYLGEKIDQNNNKLTQEKPIFATVIPTQEKGNYLAEVIFPNVGKYKLTLIMSKKNLDAQVIIPNIIIPLEIPKLAENKLINQNTNHNQNIRVNYIIIGIICFISFMLNIIVTKKFFEKDNKNNSTY